MQGIDVGVKWKFLEIAPIESLISRCDSDISQGSRRALLDNPQMLGSAFWVLLETVPI